MPQQPVHLPIESGGHMLMNDLASEVQLLASAALAVLVAVAQYDSA
jgi:hypothetical protein